VVIGISGSLSGTKHPQTIPAGTGGHRPSSWPPVRRIPSQHTPWTGSATYYYATDHPGNVLGLFNASNQVVSQYRYDPWGTVQWQSDPTFNTLRYAGRYYDWDTGLYHNRNRWYDSHVGRFISEDPLGLEGGINPYAYAANNPVDLTDPFGLDPCTVSQAQTTACAIPLPGVVVGSGGGIWGALGRAFFGWALNRAASSAVSGRFSPSATNPAPGMFLPGHSDAMESPEWYADPVAAVTSGGVVGHGVKKIGTAGHSIWLRSYPKAGGVGLGLSQHGKRVISIDWHHFRKYGREMNRPHINDSATGSV
jgi:RHS repeat-associated protein